MGLGTIVRLTEDLLYQIAVWILLIPKTFSKVVLNPSWIPRYVAEELEKPAEDRFDAYVSPLIFFVLVAIVPNLIANTFWPAIPYTDLATRRTVVDEAAGLGEEHRFLFYAAMWILLPLSYAFLHQVVGSKEISSSALKPAFYTQCFRLTPLSLVFATRFVIQLSVQPGWSHLWLVNWAAILLVGAWLISSEVVVARAELGVSRNRAFLLAIGGVALYYVFLLPVLLVFAAISQAD